MLSVRRLNFFSVYGYTLWVSSDEKYVPAGVYVLRSAVKCQTSTRSCGAIYANGEYLRVEYNGSTLASFILRSSCGISTMVVRRLPKPKTRVRFSYPAPEIFQRLDRK